MQLNKEAKSKKQKRMTKCLKQKTLRNNKESEIQFSQCSISE